MKLRWKIAIGVAVLAIAGLGYAGNYFYDYAVVPSEKDFLEGDTPGTDENQTGNESQNWFTDPTNREMWQLTSEDDLKLSAIYLPAEEKNRGKTAIIAHGYMGNAETMADYAKMYHDLGYNVLVPDAQGMVKAKEIILVLGGTNVRIICNGSMRYSQKMVLKKRSLCMASVWGLPR